MKTATLVKDNLRHFNGHAAFYRLSEPIHYVSWADENDIRDYDYVIVSTANAFGYWETYIFGANSEGAVLNWTELEGSRKGTLSHKEVLKNAGYTLV